MVKKIRNDSIFKKPSTTNSLKSKRISKNYIEHNKQNYKIFYKFSFISLILIFSFFYLPNLSKYLKDNFAKNKTIINVSKKNFELTLNNKSSKIIEKSTNLEEVFEDIDVFSSDEKNTNTSRLSASTIEQLFKDTNYNLKKVKKTKLVNIGNNLDHLPSEMKNIENVKKRKNLFIQIVLPLIIEENTKIKLDRKKLFVILNKNSNSKSDIEWLKNKFKQYGVAKNDLSTLKIRMDEIPVSLAIAQAAKETGWGTSRFAQEGNALFGQWTWSGEGLKPKDAEKDQGHKVMKFNVLQASVRAYQRNLNTHSSYKNLRKARAVLRDKGKPLDSLILVKFLNQYAETGEKYVEVLTKIINQNNLKDFDDAKLLPSSIELESLI